MTSRRARALGLSIAIAAGLGSAAQGQFIGTNFSGTDEAFAGFEPPDTMGGIGPNHFVEFINGAYAVYNKFGTTIGSKTDENAFWTTAFTNSGTPFSPGELNITDPRVFYDQLSRRWFAVEVTTSTNEVMVARSNSNDPTAGWKAVKFAATTGGGSFPDYPTMGFDANGVYVGANMFGGAGGVSVYSLPKADILASTPTAANLTRFANQTVASTGWTPQPVVDFTPGKVSGEAVLTILNGAPSGATVLKRRTVNGAGGPGATLTAATNITVTSYSVPPDGRQPGSAAVLDSIDGRIQSTAYQVGNNIWAVHSVNVGGFANLRWYKIDATTNTVLLSGTIADGSFDLISPSIAANANDQVIIGATRSGSTAGTGLAGSYAFVGTPGAGTENFSASIQLKAGAAAYSTGANPQRWGDYSATSVDPSDPSIFWTTQEWAKASNNWSTQITELIVPMANEFRWKNPVSDNFSTATAWLTGSAPTGTSHAIFSRATSATYTVTINSNQTNDRLSVRQGSVDFNNSATYSLTNASLTTPSFVLGEFEASPTLKLRGTGTLATVHSFIAPNAVSTGSLIVQDTHSWINSGDVYVGGTNLAAGGAGSVILNNTPNVQIGGTLKVWNTGSVLYNGGSLSAGALDVATGGKVLLSTGANKTVRAGSVAVAGTGKVDLADNTMVVDYTGGSPLAAVRALLVAGYNGGAWTGNGITSSTAAANAAATHKTALGFGEATDVFSIFPATFRGNTVDNTSVLIRYTFYGDANLDGSVDTTDVNNLAANFSQPVDRWSKGDFNYDGVVDTVDFNLLVSNFSLSIPAPAEGSLGAVIPEPSNIGLALAGLAISCRHRRRR